MTAVTKRISNGSTMNIPQPSFTPSATPLLAFTAGGGAVSVGLPVPRFVPQNRHTFAAALIVSAQYGQVFISQYIRRDFDEKDA